MNRIFTFFNYKKHDIIKYIVAFVYSSNMLKINFKT